MASLMLFPEGMDKFTISLNFPGQFFLGMNPMGLRWTPSQGEVARLPALTSSSMLSSTLEARARVEGKIALEETSVAEGLNSKRKPSQIPLLRKSANCESSRVLRKGSHSFLGGSPEASLRGSLTGLM